MHSPDDKAFEKPISFRNFRDSFRGKSLLSESFKKDDEQQDLDHKSNETERDEAGTNAYGPLTGKSSSNDGGFTEKLNFEDS